MGLHSEPRGCRGTTIPKLQRLATAEMLDIRARHVSELYTYPRRSNPSISLKEAADSTTIELHSTISKDNTAGESARAASLLAILGRTTKDLVDRCHQHGQPYMITAQHGVSQAPSDQWMDATEISPLTNPFAQKTPTFAQSLRQLHEQLQHNSDTGTKDKIEVWDSAMENFGPSHFQPDSPVNIEGDATNESMFTVWFTTDTSMFSEGVTEVLELESSAPRTQHDVTQIVYDASNVADIGQLPSTEKIVYLRTERGTTITRQGSEVQKGANGQASRARRGAAYLDRAFTANGLDTQHNGIRALQDTPKDTKSIRHSKIKREPLDAELTHMLSKQRDLADCIKELPPENDKLSKLRLPTVEDLHLGLTGSPVHTTVSKDHTAGQHARHADLLSHLGRTMKDFARE